MYYLKTTAITVKQEGTPVIWVVTKSQELCSTVEFCLHSSQKEMLNFHYTLAKCRCCVCSRVMHWLTSHSSAEQSQLQNPCAGIAFEEVLPEGSFCLSLITSTAHFSEPELSTAQLQASSLWSEYTHRFWSASRRQTQVFSSAPSLHAPARCCESPSFPAQASDQWMVASPWPLGTCSSFLAKRLPIKTCASELNLMLKNISVVTYSWKVVRSVWVTSSAKLPDVVNLEHGGAMLTMHSSNKWRKSKGLYSQKETKTPKVKVLVLLS